MEINKKIGNLGSLPISVQYQKIKRIRFNLSELKKKTEDMQRVRVLAENHQWVGWIPGRAIALPFRKLMVNCSFTNAPCQHIFSEDSWGGGLCLHLFQCFYTGQPTLFEDTQELFGRPQLSPAEK